VPPIVLWSLGAVIGAVVLAGLVLGRGGLRWGLALLLAASFALPIVSQVPSAADLGLIWQGRYGLPLSIGLPVVAMAAICSRASGARVTRWVGLFLAPFVAAVHVASFGWSLWRYAYGLDNRPFSVPAEWAPPAGWLAPVAFVAANAGLMLLVLVQPGGPLRARRGQDETPAVEPGDPAVQETVSNSG
jgi:hypothetical protein